MPPLSATGPGTGTEPRRERPRCRSPCLLLPAAPGSFTSRLQVSVVALLQRVDPACEHAKMIPHNRGHFCREHRRSDPGLFGSEGARQGCPPFLRRCAALTRAMRSRCFGSYRSVGGCCAGAEWRTIKPWPPWGGLTTPHPREAARSQSLNCHEPIASPSALTISSTQPRGPDPDDSTKSMSVATSPVCRPHSGKDLLRERRDGAVRGTWQLLSLA